MRSWNAMRFDGCGGARRPRVLQCGEGSDAQCAADAGQYVHATLARDHVDHVDLLHDLGAMRSEEHTSELQSQSNLVCRLLLEKKKKKAAHRARQLRHVTKRS